MSHSLTALPVETIDRIIEHVKSKEALKSLALCSKHLHDLTLPFLYAHVELSAGTGAQRLKLVYLRPLTLLFWRKPQYARHVRHLTIHEDWKEGTDYGAERHWVDVKVENERSLSVDDDEEGLVSGEDDEEELVLREDGEDEEEASVPEKQSVLRADGKDEEEASVPEKQSVSREDGEDEEEASVPEKQSVPREDSEDEETSSEESEEQLPLTEPEEEFKAAVKASSLTYDEEQSWLRHLSDPRNEDALIGLLLPTLTRLEKLDVMIGRGYDYFLKMMLRAGSGEKPFTPGNRLNYLADIMNTEWDEVIGLSLDCTVSYLRLPAIQRIFCIEFKGADDEEDYPVHEMLSTLEERSSTVKHLEFKHSRLNRLDILHLLKIPKSLETFIYEFNELHDTWCPGCFCTTREAIGYQAGSLQDLWLDYPHGSIELGVIDSVYNPPMASFADFAKLKRLRLAPVFIFGIYPDSLEDAQNVIIKAIPKQLEVLHFTHCEYSFPILASALLQLLYRREECAPSLQKLVLEGPFADKRELWDDATKVIRAAQSAGLSIELLNNHEGRERDFSGFKERGWGMDEEFPWTTSMCGFHARPVYDIVELDVDNI
ncbi:hypothetical protein LTR66_003771 [Elasticomyces elasticus]|nr:hypothetical protein LTR66_003771 [Elasticomyces elasticus]